MTRFLTELTCKVCGQPMKLNEPDGGFTAPWPEEDERGNTIAEHWSRSWVCECGVHAEEGAIDDNPFSDDPGEDYLMPDGEPLSWYCNDPCPHCGSTYTERIDTIGDEPVVWTCQCYNCPESFEVLIPPEVAGGH